MNTKWLAMGLIAVGFIVTMIVLSISSYLERRTSTKYLHGCKTEPVCTLEVMNYGTGNGQWKCQCVKGE